MASPNGFWKSFERYKKYLPKDPEALVRAEFWQKLKTQAGKAPFVRDVVAMFYCAIDPNTPVSSRAIIWAALAYFVAPLDLIPDILMAAGLADDAAVISAALYALRQNLRPEHYQRADRFLFEQKVTVEIPKALPPAS